MAGLVEVDHQRRVVRWDRLAFPALAIDLRPHGALRQRSGYQQVVDPHAEVLVEGAGPVIPPGVAAGLIVMETIAVHQTPATQAGERLALPRRHVGPAVADSRIPYVSVVGSEVEIAADNERLGWIGGLVEPASETVVPLQLGFVESRADDS